MKWPSGSRPYQVWGITCSFPRSQEMCKDMCCTSGPCVLSAFYFFQGGDILGVVLHFENLLFVAKLLPR